MITCKTTQSNPTWLAGVKKKMEALTKQEVAVGFPKGAEGTSSPYYEDGASVLQVAIWNNYGLGVPRRPFFDNAVVRIRKQAPMVVMSAVKKSPDDPQKVLAFLGEWAKALIQQSIRETTSPPNHPATIERKGSAHPLIDTGALIQHVTYAVRGRGGE